MGRSRQSAFDDLLVIASRLPWQVSLSLAALTFLGLHGLAVAFASAPTAITVADMSSAVIHQYVHVGALFAQFVVPAAFLIGAAVSYFKRSRSIRLLDDTRTSAGPAVASLTWQQFESLVAEGFRQRGFTVTEKGGAAPDGGVDLVLTGVTSRNGFFSPLRLGGWGFPLPKRPEPTLGDAFVRMPVVVPGQMDVVPWQRGQVL